jgi:signal transduction histidine kinase/DNA-binding NarL/FixJ family response regulator
MFSKYSYSPRGQVELAKRSFSSAIGHIALVAVVYYSTDLFTNFPRQAFAFAGVIVFTNVARLLFGFINSFVFVGQLSMIALAWGGFCAFSLSTYGIQHESTLILLLVNSGIAAAAITALVPSYKTAVGFLTLLITLPLVESLNHDFGKPIALILMTYYLFLILQLHAQATLYDDREKIEEALKKAASIKAQFIANVSHEIRTPINGILGMANLLSKENLSANGAHYLNVMTSCGDTLLTLINDILDFSKMEAGKLQLENVDFNVNSVLREVAEFFRPRAIEKGIEIDVQSGISDDFWALADSTRLRQVLNNLIGNAVKFTPKGKVSVHANHKAVGENFEIQVDVKDTGIGIPDNVKNKLFQSFTQVDASTTRKFGGTGLGLVICKGICESMGGDIWLESKLGEGSTFSFKILVNAGAFHEVAPKKSEFDRQFAEQRPFKILVADDNATNQLLAKQYLEMLGYRVDCVANGLEVLDAISTRPYDVIFMDGHMPEMDGFITTQKLRQRLAHKEQPWIIALTASATAKDQQYCRDAGMDDFVAKPFTLNSLAESLVRIPQKSVFLNRALLIQHFAGDPEIMVRFINGYLKSYAKMIMNLRQALETQNKKNLTSAAHALRGSVANFFATGICELLKEIEYGENLSWAQIAEKVTRAERDLLSLNAQIEDFAKSPKAA